jgi:mono/diheme cytochrome c family protein
MGLTGNRLFIYMSIATIAIIFVLLFILILAKGKTITNPTAGNNPPKTAIQIPAQYLNPTAELLEHGRQVYLQNCASCHGDSGKGDGPSGTQFNPRPRDFALDKLINGAKPSDLFRTITTGMPGSMMASFQFLSEPDRAAVAHYVRTFMPDSPNEDASQKAKTN